MTTPKVTGKSASSPAPADGKTLNATRRRLSVMSDNKLVEGMDNVNIDGKEESGGVEVSLKHKHVNIF